MKHCVGLRAGSDRVRVYARQHWICTEDHFISHGDEACGWNFWLEMDQASPADYMYICSLDYGYAPRSCLLSKLVQLGHDQGDVSRVCAAR